MRPWKKTFSCASHAVLKSLGSPIESADDGHTKGRLAIMVKDAALGHDLGWAPQAMRLGYHVSDKIRLPVA